MKNSITFHVIERVIARGRPCAAFIHRYLGNGLSTAAARFLVDSLLGNKKQKMSQFDSERVIQNIVGELVQECTRRRHVLTETLVAFMVSKPGKPGRLPSPGSHLYLFVFHVFRWKLSCWTQQTALMLTENSLNQRWRNLKRFLFLFVCLWGWSFLKV